jgi:hypothetical protein
MRRPTSTCGPSPLRRHDEERGTLRLSTTRLDLARDRDRWVLTSIAVLPGPTPTDPGSLYVPGAKGFSPYRAEAGS